MIETHPFGDFVPPKARFLTLGSFPGKPEPGNDWFYSSKRNQFWPILEEVYQVKLKDKKSKQELLIKLKIAITDIIYRCERRKGTNLDINLVNIVYNISAIQKILKLNKIEKIFFTSRYVEKKFRKFFKNATAELITLPSPSPRYALMSKQEKINRYKKLLPKLNSNYFL